MKRGFIILTLILLSIFLIACDSQEINQCNFDYNSINDIRGVITDEKVVETGTAPWISTYKIVTIKMQECDIIAFKSSVIYDGSLPDERTEISKNCLEGSVGDGVLFKGHYKRYNINSKNYYDLTPSSCTKSSKEVKKAVDVT